MHSFFHNNRFFCSIAKPDNDNSNNNNNNNNKTAIKKQHIRTHKHTNTRTHTHIEKELEAFEQKLHTHEMSAFLKELSPEQQLDLLSVEDRPITIDDSDIKANEISGSESDHTKHVHIPTPDADADDVN